MVATTTVSASTNVVVEPTTLTTAETSIQEHNVCKGCNLQFPSRSAVFRHLNETQAKCLSDPDRDDYMVHMSKHQKREKVILLYGYWIPPIYEYPFESSNHKNEEKKPVDVIRNGEDVAQLILEIVEDAVITTDYSGGDSTSIAQHQQQQPQQLISQKANRSYGHIRSNVIAQEDGTSAITEVLSTKLLPLTGENMKQSISEWVKTTNRQIVERLQNLSSNAEIRLLGRQHMPLGKFNAEMDISHRRVEYLLPAEFLLPFRLLNDLPSFTEETRHRNTPVVAVVTDDGDIDKNDDDDDIDDDIDDTINNVPATADVVVVSTFQPPNDEILNILTKFKRLMKHLTTHVIDLDIADAAAVFEKQFHDQKRKKQRDFRNNNNDKRTNNKKSKDHSVKVNQQLDTTSMERLLTEDKDAAASIVESNGEQPEMGKKRERNTKAVTSTTPKVKNDKVLRRKRYHNFTPSVMAHEYLSYRRMDRFYHRATFRLDNTENEKCRPYFALSMSGDMFLTGQACRVVGLFIAIARGLIDDDFIDCVFDETYPHLVPTPPLPNFAQYASDVYYISIEGKVKAILTPRRIDRYENGWNDEETAQSMRDWQANVRRNVARSWMELGIDTSGSLLAVQQWTESILEPWTVRAKAQLGDYLRWKQTVNVPQQVSEITTKSDSMIVESLPSLSTTMSVIDPTVPLLFEKVLLYLRKANESGLWPSTTPKRQLVMMSNVTSLVDGDDVATKPVSSSLSMAHSKARNNKISKNSAYVFVEGQGGASGSFSLGAMPGDKCLQPKGNTLFPELMTAAFELEVALFPHREPSSTIAVNRNAQFRPHTDSGAGAGQSTSLIVGLGTYSGGELMVEGTMIDIRYKAIEFDGWKQRHWTMPFHGERYSLVWFTPKGCEGINFVNQS